MNTITTTSRLYCIFGSPVGHSLSPAIHNAAFAFHGIDAVYLAFEPRDIAGAVGSVRALDIQGASVTIPFKESILPHLDWVDPLAEKIGAVNTLVNEGGILKGYNTDLRAAVDPLDAHGIQGKEVLVLGAGGAAKAVAHGIQDRGGRVTIANRSSKAGEELARACGGRYFPMDDAQSLRPEMIINTTPVGMDKTPGLSCPPDCMEHRPVVMDVVYTPRRTQLIELAREKGCPTVDGLAMFVSQAAAQFEHWTGIKPENEKMKSWALEGIQYQKEKNKGA